MRVVFIDCETGGLDASRHPIIQVAAIAVDQELEPLETFSAKVRFKEADADPEALRINSYDADVWAREAIPPGQVAAQLGQFLKQYASVEFVSRRTGRPYLVAQLAGHNAEFDFRFLQAMFRKSGQFFPASPHVLCTKGLALWWSLCRGDEEGQLGDLYAADRARFTKLPASLKLEDLCQHFGIEIEAHDALEDVRATVSLARELLAEGCTTGRNEIAQPEQINPPTGAERREALNNPDLRPLQGRSGAADHSGEAVWLQPPTNGGEAA